MLTDHLHPICWGWNESGQTDYPIGRTKLKFKSITSGGWHTCAISIAEQLSMPLCWGTNDEGQVDVPDIVDRGVRVISAGIEHNCVVEQNGGVACWG